MNFDFDIFDDYLEGRLSAAAAAALEMRLASDAVLAKEFELHKTARNVVIRVAKAREITLATKERLRQEGFFEQFQDVKRPTSTPNLWAWAACSLFILLAADAFWHYWQMKKREQERLQAEAFQANLLSDNQQLRSERDTLRLVVDGALDGAFVGSTNYDPDEDGNTHHYTEAIAYAQQENKIMRKEIAQLLAPQHFNEVQGNNDADDLPSKAYEAGKYLEAINLWQNNPPQDSVKIVLDLYWLPYAYFKAGKFKEAIKTFKELRRLNPKRTKETDYFLLLCYFAEGDDKAARSMQTTILGFGSQQKHPHYDKAKAMGPLLNMKK